MKHLLPLGLTLLSTAALAAPSNVPSQIFEGEYLTSVSDNGEWVVGTTDIGTGIVIRNLVTNKVWAYAPSGSVESLGYIAGSDRAVSDNGVVVGELNDQPMFWVNGQWNPLPVLSKTGSAFVGSITPDGSMIVGGVGVVGFGIEEVQMIYPCIWNRTEDGTYSDPVMLPYPEKDFMGTTPQYLYGISVSPDGKVIGASMTSSYGAHHVPYVYTLGDDGNWTYKDLGMSLINPEGRVFPKYPGDYSGPMRPNWEEYLTEQEKNRFFSEFPAWAAKQEQAGYTDEEIELLQLEYVGTFMSGTRKQEYTKLINEYFEAYYAWLKEYSDFEGMLATVLMEGRDFMMNNVRLSPDGKYLYATGTRIVDIDPNNPDNPFTEEKAPVKFDIATGEYELFSPEYNVLISSISNNYDILGRHYELDGDLPVMAYIYPDSSFTALDFPEYFLSIGDDNAFNWLEENTLKEVIVDVNQFGQYITDDRFSLGKPMCTPNMSLLFFTTSTWYWTEDTGAHYVTYMINTGLDLTEVESVETTPECTVKAMRGGNIEIKGDVKSVAVYDLSGAVVFSANAPQGVVSTGLSQGVYVIRAIGANGNVISEKALF